MTVEHEPVSYSEVRRFLPILALVGLYGCGEAPSLIACDEAIKATLKAPASYKRVSVSGTDSTREITYDAVNSYNAPLRAHGTCIYDDRTNKAIWIDIDSARREADSFHP